MQLLAEFITAAFILVLVPFCAAWGHYIATGQYLPFN